MREQPTLRVGSNRFGTKAKVGRRLVSGEQRLELKFCEIVGGNRLPVWSILVSVHKKERKLARSFLAGFEP